MNRSSFQLALCGIAALYLGGCSSGSSSTPSVPLTSYTGATGTFSAYVNDQSNVYAITAIGSYGGKKQSLRGTLDYLTGLDVGQMAGIEIYEASDGHVYAVDLTSPALPAPVQLSSESAATTNDSCTLSGTQVTGADYNYTGTYFVADLVNPTNSSYFYRLPGPDGVCDTADDVIHLVKTGMTASSAPIVASAMPVATVRTAAGGISGFVITDGANLDLVDSNFANPLVLGTFANPIGVADALPVGTTSGYPTGQLYVVDGNIVYVDYVAHTVSSNLFSIPSWTPGKAGATFAASPTTLYFYINTPANGSIAATTTVYAMPADGSAAPAVIATNTGQGQTLLFPVGGAALLFGAFINNQYSIVSYTEASGTIASLMTGNENAGTFIATANTVYYTLWNSSSSSKTLTTTHTDTEAGIVGLDGTVIAQPIADAAFASGGEQLPWPNDTTTTQTAYETVFLVENLSPVTVTDSANGYTYTEDGVNGGSLIAINTSSNAQGVTVGTLPISTAVGLTGTFRDGEHAGFLEATNPASTDDPATRDLYFLNSLVATSLSRASSNL